MIERPLPPSPTPLMSKTKHWLVTAVARAMESSTSRSIVPVRVGRRITSAPITASVREVSGIHMS